jgi:hypothetical protein
MGIGETLSSDTLSSGGALTKPMIGYRYAHVKPIVAFSPFPGGWDGGFFEEE